MKINFVAFSIIAILLFIPITHSYALSYDKNGNMIEDDKHVYSYDALNRLSKVIEKSSENIIAEYFYDENDMRILKKEYSDSNKTILYVSDDYIVENTDGDIREEYIYHHGLDIVGKINSEGIYFYHPDHLGSTTLVTDENGSIVEETEYLPFGEVIKGGNDRFTFTGQENDKETELMYYGARYYSPFLRRFVQPDSIIPDIYDPQSLNRYAYVRNNPLKYTDPDGHFFVIAATILIGSAVYGSSYSAIFTGVEYFDQISEVMTEQGVSYFEAREIVINSPELTELRQDAAKSGLIIGAAQGMLDTVLSQISFKSKTTMYNPKQLQKKFGKHANVFGVKGTNTVVDREAFRQALEAHRTSKDTIKISGTFRSKIPGTHHYNPETGLWSFYDKNSDWISGWKLDTQQIKDLMEKNNVW